MKLLRILEKDIKLLFRDPRTFILVFLTPAIIILVLANVFSTVSSEQLIKGIPLGLCLKDKTAQKLDIPILSIKDLGEDCDEKAKDLVSEGKLGGSIIIPENFERNIKEGYGSKLILYNDNSRAQQSAIVSATVRAVIQNKSEEIGAAFIESAWVNLRELNSKLKIVAENLIIVKESAERVKNEVETATQAIKSIKLDLVIDQLGSSQQFQNLVKERFLAINLTNLNNYFSSLSLYASVLNISSLNEQLNNLNNSISQINRALSDVNASNNSFSALNEIEKINQTKNNALFKLDTLHDEIINFTDQLINFQEELNTTTIVLEKYTNTPPQNIVKPITVEEHKAFAKARYIDFMIPGLIPIVLLFISVLMSSISIVSERSSGAILRNYLAPISFNLFIIEKALINLILAFLQILSMLVVAYLFNINLVLNLDFLAVVFVASFTFISLGIFIGAISKSENTALLTSLVFNLPMLFLAGLFFPFEIMSQFMRSIAQYMPLTIVVKNMWSVMLYKVEIEYVSLAVMFLLSIVLIFISSYIIKRNPVID